MAVNRPPVNPKKLRPYDQPPKVRRSLIPSGPDSAATAFVVAGVVWLAAALGIGALWAALRVVPDLVVLSLDIPLLVVPDLLHVELSATTAGLGFWNALVFGWLGNALIGASLFAVTRLTGRRLHFPRMLFLAALLWNMGMLGGLAAVYVPILTAPGTLSAFPFAIDGALAPALLIVTASVLRTVLASPRSFPYPGVAFTLVGLLALLAAVGTGAAVETLDFFIAIDPTLRALWDALYVRMLIGLGFGGLTLGTLFYAVPRVTGNPLWSIGTAWLTWLLWAAFGSLALLGALEDTSIPFLITQAGNAAGLMLLAPALLAAANLLLTVSGRWTLLLSPGALAFGVVGVAFVAAAGLLGAIGALGNVHSFVRGTAWESGVLLWLTAGAGGFAALSVADHALPRLLHRDWRSGLLTSVALYGIFAGVAWAGFSLITGGLAEGSLRVLGTPADEAMGHLVWYALSAAAGFGLAALGGLASLVDLFLQYTTARRAAYAMPPEATTAMEPAGAGAAN